MQKLKIKLNFTDEAGMTRFVNKVSNLPYDGDLSNDLTTVDAKSIVALFQMVGSKELVLTLHTDDETESEKFTEWMV